MNPADFTNPQGQLVTRTDKDGDYSAFIPNRLPPNLEVRGAVLSKLSEANQFLGRLEGLSFRVPNPRLFAPFLHREAMLSSRIEGTITTYGEVYALEAGQLRLFLESSELDSDDPREVVNYVKAMEYGFDRLSEFPFSKRFLQELHRILLREVRGERGRPGEFRKSQNAIGSPTDTLRQARFVPPPIPEMYQSLDDLEHYINSGNDYPPLIRLALIHYQFEVIHPFMDGNGRLGRLMLSLLLKNWGLLTYPLLYMSVFFERNRDAYYEHLYQISAQGKWLDWIEFFLTGVIEQSQESAELAIGFMSLQGEWRKRLENIGATANWLLLADTLFRTPVITIPQAAESLGVTWLAAKNMVEHLLKVGILERLGDQERPRVYCAPEIIKLLERN